MATGDQNDLFNRLKANLVNWFNSNTPLPNPNPDGVTTNTPNLDAILQGLAATESIFYSNIQYAESQTRLNAAGVPTVPQMNGIFLDLFSNDFFGDQLPRHQDESDSSYRARIAANLIQERATKKGMITAIQKLTGIPPIVLEGFNSQDCGFYHNDLTLVPPGAPVGNTSLCYDNGIGYGFNMPYVGIIYAFIPFTTSRFITFGSYDQPKTPGENYGAFYYAGDVPGVTPENFNNIYFDFSNIDTTVVPNDVVTLIENTKCFGTFIYYAVIQGGVVKASNFLPVPT